MLISALARSASSRSNTGAPRPAGTPSATTSTIPPAEEPSLRTSSRNPAQRSAAAASGLQNGLRSTSSQSQRARSIAMRTDLHQRAANAHALAEHAPGDGSRRHPHRRLPGARAAAAAIVADAVLRLVGEIGVAGAESVLDRRVVLGAGVLVDDQQADRRAGGQPLEHAREDLHPIRLPPLSGEARLARAPAIEPAPGCRPRPAAAAADSRRRRSRSLARGSRRSW